MTRTFEIEYTVYATIELEDSVIDVVDDEWKNTLYNLETPEEIAEHIGRNMIRGATLSDLDGWVDQPDSNAKLTIDDTDIEVKEI